MTREEAETLIGTLIACVNEAHAAVSYEWRDSCWKAADAAGERVVLALTGAQNAPNFADAYQGAMEEVAIWKKRALEAEDLNRKFIAEINGPMLMGEPGAQPAPSALAEAIIADMQAQHDSELITENDSGEALIRLDGAIAAVEDNFALAQPAPSVPVDLITDYLVSISAHVAHQDDPKAQAEIGELLRMLAAASEAKT